MNKAEEYSFNIPSELFQQLTKEQQVLWRKEIENTFNNGYQQAEKANELTWEDIEKITDIWDDLHEDETVYIKTGCDTPEFYQEVLKRFKEIKK